MLMIEYLTLTKLFYIDVIASIIQLYWRTFLYSALYCINLFLTPELEIDQPDPTRPSHYVRQVILTQLNRGHAYSTNNASASKRYDTTSSSMLLLHSATLGLRR